jgi:GNAT superfamily N-acetyltransferase
MIRRAQTQDRDAVFALAKSFATSFEVEEMVFRSAFTALITDESAYVAVAEIEQEIVGYVLAWSHETFYANGPVAWVEEITVATNHRRQGIGKALMEGVEEWASNRGCKLVALATRRAADFYAAIGYEASATYFRKKI